MSGFYILEIGSLVFTVILGALFSFSKLAQFDLQIVAILFIVYFFARKFFQKSSLLLLIEANIFVFIIVSLVFANGGVRSPFFFLLYFLLFASALVLDSTISLILTLVLVMIFILTLESGISFKELLPVLSLPLIAPFAKYMGDLKKHDYFHRQEINKLTKANERNKNLKQYTKEQTLIFLTTVLRRLLDDFNEKLDNFMGDDDLNFLKTQMKRIYETLKKFEDYVEKI